MHKDIEAVLYDEEKILSRIEELAEEIKSDYRGKDLTCICILKGGVFFMTDLLKKLDLPIVIDFMDVSSYGASTVSSGEVRIIKDLEHSVKDRDVLIVEDIIDTGITLNYVMDLMKSREAKSVEIVTLLNKHERREINLDIKYCGFDIPDHFVVGYGLDFNEKYRNLPYIGYLKEELYKK